MDRPILTEKFFDVISHEGVVSIVSWGIDEPHISNTWNSFLVVTEDSRILIPAYGLRKTQKNIEAEANHKVKLALGTREVLGYKDYPGTGFVVTGTGNYLSSGDEYDMMKEKFSFLTRVLEVKVISAKQTL